MRVTRFTRFTTCAFVLMLCLSKTVLAQSGNGDYDFDNDVDADDFINWGGCMTVPDGDNADPWSQCGAFDFNGDWDVDVRDFGAFQAAFRKDPDPTCTR